MTPVAPGPRPDDGLAGRVVLVTGGAGDVGAAVARRIAEVGGTPVVADLGASGPGAVHLDLEDDDSVAEVADRLLRDHGGCHALVHCAGVASVGAFLDSDRDTWDRLYRVNQRGPALLTQRLLPAMVEARAGRVVFVSSDSARAGAANEAMYAATKAALLGLAKSLAREHARHGVTFNVVCPGPVAGRMVESLARDNPDHLARLTRAIPLRRLADPDEVAAAVGWFLGPEGAYLTGQTLSVSGGITMY